MRRSATWISSILLGLFAYQHVDYSNDLWWRVAADADAPRFFRASVAVTIVACAVGLRQLLKPAPPPSEHLTREDLRHLHSSVLGQPFGIRYEARGSDRVDQSVRRSLDILENLRVFESDSLGPRLALPASEGNRPTRRSLDGQAKESASFEEAT